MREKKIFSKRTKALIVSFVILALMVFPVGTVNISAANVEYNYAKALQYSIYFYDANMCGTGVDEKDSTTGEATAMFMMRNFRSIL